MFDGLRHDAVVGGDAQKRDVDAGGARDHLAYEALVAGNVNHAHAAPVGKLETGESELDRDAALLLFGKPVGIGAGQRLDEARFAVVDMACRAQH